MGLHKTKKLLANKRNGQQMKEVVHTMEENLSQVHI
jgi:hypothetical protein